MKWNVNCPGEIFLLFTKGLLYLWYIVRHDFDGNDKFST